MNNLKRLSNEFYRIQCMNWIKNVGKGYSSAGKTLENILGKTDDYESLPDFDGIELKTKRNNSKSWITLFHASPDGKRTSGGLSFCLRGTEIRAGTMTATVTRI